MKKLNKKGFTLTEMIVVIAIIGILAGVLIPTITGYIKRAKLSNDEQLAASMTDEIERYCIENNISQKNLTGTDVRTILVGKEYNLAPSHKSWTYVYNAQSKEVEVLELKNLTVDWADYTQASCPSEYTENMYLVGKGKSDYEQAVNILLTAESSSSFAGLSELEDLSSSEEALITEFMPGSTLYVKNDNVIDNANGVSLFANEIKHVVFCELTFNVPAKLGTYASQLPEFKVPELISSIDDKAKTSLSSKITNMHNIKPVIAVKTLSPTYFNTNTYEITFGDYINDTVSQTINMTTLGYVVLSEEGVDTYYYVRQINACFYTIQGLSAKGTVNFLEKTYREEAMISNLGEGRLETSRLDDLGIDYAK